MYSRKINATFLTLLVSATCYVNTAFAKDPEKFRLNQEDLTWFVEPFTQKPSENWKGYLQYMISTFGLAGQKSGSNGDANPQRFKISHDEKYVAFPYSSKRFRITRTNTQRTDQAIVLELATGKVNLMSFNAKTMVPANSDCYINDFPADDQYVNFNCTDFALVSKPGVDDPTGISQASPLVIARFDLKSKTTTYVWSGMTSVPDPDPAPLTFDAPEAVKDLLLPLPFRSFHRPWSRTRSIGERHHWVGCFDSRDTQHDLFHSYLVYVDSGKKLRQVYRTSTMSVDSDVPPVHCGNNSIVYPSTPNEIYIGGGTVASIYRWNLESGEWKLVNDTAEGIRPINQSVRGIALSPDEKILTYSSYGPRVYGDEYTKTMGAIARTSTVIWMKNLETGELDFLEWKYDAASTHREFSSTSVTDVASFDKFLGNSVSIASCGGKCRCNDLKHPETSCSVSCSKKEQPMCPGTNGVRCKCYCYKNPDC